MEDVVYPGLPGPSLNKGSYAQRKYELAWKTLSLHARTWMMERFEGVHREESLAVPVAPRGGVLFSGIISVRLAPSSCSFSSSFPTSNIPTPSHLSSSLALLTFFTIFSLAEYLGGVESLAEHPARMTHGSIPAAEREVLGIGEQLVRLSVGVLDSVDSVRDLEGALGVVARGVDVYAVNVER